MPAYVIDTNVGVVANGRNCQQADDACRLACIKKLEECVEILNDKKRGYVVIDSGNEIFEEYKSYFNFNGQPGTGDMFFKVLEQRRFSTRNCEQVEINRDETRGYQEFPCDNELQDFDPSDRKFVAVAIQSQYSTTILNATDSDWHDYEEILNRYVNIEQLCPNCLRSNR